MTTALYSTLEEANTALAEAIEDATGDHPDTNPADIHHDMVLAVARLCSEDVAAELLRIRLGWSPEEIKEHLS